MILINRYGVYNMYSAYEMCGVYDDYRGIIDCSYLVI